MKYAWIVSNKAHWPITQASEVLGVRACGYFEHGRHKKLPKPSKPGAHKRMSDEDRRIKIWSPLDSICLARTKLRNSDSTTEAIPAPVRAKPKVRASSLGASALAQEPPTARIWA